MLFKCPCKEEVRLFFLLCAFINVSMQTFASLFLEFGSSEVMDVDSGAAAESEATKVIQLILYIQHDFFCTFVDVCVICDELM